eukprot:9804175-Ditylum_brightwellii.AAC.1
MAQKRGKRRQKKFEHRVPYVTACVPKSQTDANKSSCGDVGTATLGVDIMDKDDISSSYQQSTC